MTSIPSTILPVALVQFLLQFGQRQSLGLDRADGRQRDGAFGRDADELALAADARPAVDRGPQVFQLGVDLQRRDGDGGNLVVFLVEFIQRVAELGYRAAGGVDLAQQPQRDRAVGLDEQIAVELRIGERLHADLVAHVQLVGIGRFLARKPVDHVELIVDAEAIFGHVGKPLMADVFALGIGLPVDQPGRFPAPATAVTLRAIDRTDVAGSSRAKRLAKADRIGLARGK